MMGGWSALVRAPRASGRRGPGATSRPQAGEGATGGAAATGRRLCLPLRVYRYVVLAARRWVTASIVTATINTKPVITYCR